MSVHNQEQNILRVWLWFYKTLFEVSLQFQMLFMFLNHNFQNETYKLFICHSYEAILIL